MAQSNFTPIQLYRTTTAAAIPTAGNLAAGELGINLTDERLYFKNAAGVVKLLASNSGALGTVTSVDVSGGTTGLTTSGGPITSSGTITLAGTLGVANGGTGTATAFTAGSVVFAGASGVYTQDNANFFWDNANDRLGIGTASPSSKFVVSNGGAAGFEVNPTGSASAPALYSYNRSTNAYDILTTLASEVRWQTGSSPSERMRIDAAGTVGIGVTPATWTSFKALQFGDVGAIYSNNFGSGNTQTIFSNGVYHNSGYKYLQSGSAVAQYTQIGAEHRWFVAPSGNAGDAVSFTQAMTLSASGGLGIGVASPAERLDVAGNAKITSGSSFYWGDATSQITAVNGGAMRFLVGNGGEKMRIDSGGNVGIGNTAPAAKLQVKGGGTISTLAGWNTSANAMFELANPAVRFGIGYDASDHVLLQGFDSADNARNINMQVYGGLVGIGTSSPAEKLTVSGTNVGVGISGGTGSAGSPAYTNLNFRGFSSNRTAVIRSFDQSGSFAASGGLEFLVNQNMLADTLTSVMRITADLNVGIGTSSPAYKTDIVGAGVGNGVTQSLLQLKSASDAVSNSVEMLLTPLISGQTRTAIGANREGATANAAIYMATNNTERMRIDSSGNVGIGTTAPGQKLDVSVAGGNNFAGIRSQNSNTGTGIAGIEFSSDATYSKAAIGLLRQNANGQGSLVFYNASSTGAANWSTADERMRIDSSGNLLVGTTSGTGGIAGTAPRLVVEPPNTSTHGVILKSLGQSYDVGLIWNTAASGDNKFFEFGTDATYTARGSINYNRTAGLVAYNTTSDYRAKDIIGPLQDTGATIDALKVYNGKMKGATIARPMLVAHEAQEVVPYAVTGQKDAVNEDGTDKYQQMDHQSFIPLLIAEIQSLRARVAQLEGN
jgi:hypothetical protein